MNSAGDADRDPGQDVRPATILMVEDEDSLRIPVTKILRRRGFVVIEAADGRSAVDCFRARESEISVVLLDMTLPYMSGSEVLEALRRVRPDIRVVLTSGH